MKNNDTNQQSQGNASSDSSNNELERRFANTPRYVLQSGNQAVFPTVNPDDPDNNCNCVYGFSDKPIYDKFVKSALQLLTPYPLVKRYLAKQIGEADSANASGVCPGYVILDAIDPVQPVLEAATMATVLLAHQEKAGQVPVEVELIFDPDTASYHIKKHDSQKMLRIESQYIVQ